MMIENQGTAKMRPVVRQMLAGFFGLGLLGLSSPALAEKYALLVGISDYPRAEDQLFGPANDVALMWTVLRQRGFEPENIVVLADRVNQEDGPVPISGAPTYGVIIEALARMGERAEPGDFLFLYLSGHGSQVPEFADTGATREPDGLNEIFLPLDVGSWRNEEERVENSLVDDEVGTLIHAIRDKGATVWVVVDACYSATMTRSAGDSALRYRTRSPESLGIPPGLLQSARQAAATRSGTAARRSEAPWARLAAAGGAGEGDIIAFFAAQSDQLAIETDLPKRGGERRAHGLLSYYLAEALARGAQVTYRDIANQVMAGFAKHPGSDMPTPLFEGPLDQATFGEAGAAFQGYLVERPLSGDRLQMPAGRLQGLEPGLTVSLHDPAEPEGAPLALAEVTAVGVADSELEILSSEKPLYRLPRRLIGRPQEVPLSLSLTVGLPFGPTATAEELALAEAALALLQQKGGARLLALDFVPASAAADIYLRVEEGALWLLNGQAAWREEPDPQGRHRLPIVPLADGAEETADALELALRQVAQAKNLITVAGALGQDPLQDSLKVESYLLADRGPRTSATPADNRDCQREPHDRIPADAQPFELVNTPDIFHCDAIYLRLENLGDKPIDIGLLYVGGEGCIYQLGRYRDGIRLMPGAAPEIVKVQLVSWNTRSNEALPIGVERLLLFANELQDDGDLATVRTWRQFARGCLESREQPIRGAALSGLEQLLADAVAGNGQVRSAAVSKLDRTAALVVGWRLRAPLEVE